MKAKKRIINTNIRLNLCDEQDRQAWEYLQTMDRKKYKSYTRAVVAALNDYFSREYRNEADPYLETREKEDDFLERVEIAIPSRSALAIQPAKKLLPVPTGPIKSRPTFFLFISAQFSTYCFAIIIFRLLPLSFSNFHSQNLFSRSPTDFR